MSTIRSAVLALLSAAGTVQAGEAVRYLELLNRSNESVTGVAVAPADTDRFRPLPMDVLSGGGGSTMLAVANAGCRYDLRVVFGNGQQVMYPGVDACKGGKLVISSQAKDGRYPLTASKAR
jgi:hypothetical protein